MKKFLMTLSVFLALTAGVSANSYADMDYAMGMITGYSNGTMMGNLGALSHQMMQTNNDDEQSSVNETPTPTQATPKVAQNINMSNPSLQEKKDNMNSAKICIGILLLFLVSIIFVWSRKFIKK